MWQEKYLCGQHMRGWEYFVSTVGINRTVSKTTIETKILEWFTFQVITFGDGR